MDIEKYLLNKGFMPSLKGFEYIVFAIQLIRNDKKYKREITIRLYPDIAKEFNDLPSRVERAIRHSIFRAGINYTNSEFLAIAELETRK